MNLKQAELHKEYTVQEVRTGDRELEAFLFSLGCYSGEPITVISRRWSGCTVAIKDGRYHMDRQLAEAVTVE
jgi:ferrous iron transport protein A